MRASERKLRIPVVAPVIEDMPPLGELLRDPRVVRLTILSRTLWYEHDLTNDEMRFVGSLFTALGYPELTMPLHPQWWIERVHVDDRARVVELHERAIAERRREWSFGYRLQRSDGSYAYIEGFGTLIVDGTGRPLRINGVVSDVSEAREAEAALAERERQFRVLAESARDLICRHAVDGTYEYVSPASRDWLGREPEALVGRSPFEFIHPDDAERVRVAHGALLAGHEANETFRFRHADGSYRWCDSAASPLFEEPEREVVGILTVTRDVTTQVELRQRMALVERLDAIGRVAGGVAHDFANFLQVAQAGLAELAAERDHAARAEILGEVQTAIERSVALNAQLLALGRRQTLSPRDTDLDAAIAATLPMLERAAGRGVTITLERASGGCRVRVDCTQLERCLLNLVINARDAMRGRGHVTIEVEAVDLAESRGHRHGEIPAGRWTVVRVVDDGPGMEAATLDRVFEPFFSTKPTGEGTGLGLPTVLGIASQLGGHVVIESAPAKGTRVSLFFPRIEPC